MLSAAALLIALAIPAGDMPPGCDTPPCAAESAPAEPASVPPDIFIPYSGIEFHDIERARQNAARDTVNSYERTVALYADRLKRHREELLAESLYDTMTLEQQYDALRKKIKARQSDELKKTRNLKNK